MMHFFKKFFNVLLRRKKSYSPIPPQAEHPEQPPAILSEGEDYALQPLPFRKAETSKKSQRRKKKAQPPSLEPTSDSESTPIISTDKTTYHTMAVTADSSLQAASAAPRQPGFFARLFGVSSRHPMANSLPADETARKTDQDIRTQFEEFKKACQKLQERTTSPGNAPFSLEQMAIINHITFTSDPSAIAPFPAPSIDLEVMVFFEKYRNQLIDSNSILFNKKTPETDSDYINGINHFKMIRNTMDASPIAILYRLHCALETFLRTAQENTYIQAYMSHFPVQHFEHIHHILGQIFQPFTAKISTQPFSLSQLYQPQYQNAPLTTQQAGEILHHISGIEAAPISAPQAFDSAKNTLLHCLTEAQKVLGTTSTTKFLNPYFLPKMGKTLASPTWNEREHYYEQTINTIDNELSTLVPLAQQNKEYGFRITELNKEKKDLQQLLLNQHSTIALFWDAAVNLSNAMTGVSYFIFTHQASQTFSSRTTVVPASTPTHTAIIRGKQAVRNEQARQKQLKEIDTILAIYFTSYHETIVKIQHALSSLLIHLTYNDREADINHLCLKIDQENLQYFSTLSSHISPGKLENFIYECQQPNTIAKALPFLSPLYKLLEEAVSFKYYDQSYCDMTLIPFLKDQCTHKDLPIFAKILGKAIVSSLTEPNINRFYMINQSFIMVNNVLYNAKKKDKLDHFTPSLDQYAEELKRHYDHYRDILGVKLRLENAISTPDEDYRPFIQTPKKLFHALTHLQPLTGETNQQNNREKLVKYAYFLLGPFKNSELFYISKASLKEVLSATVPNEKLVEDLLVAMGYTKHAMPEAKRTFFLDNILYVDLHLISHDLNEIERYFSPSFNPQAFTRNFTLRKKGLELHQFPPLFRDIMDKALAKSTSPCHETFSCLKDLFSNTTAEISPLITKAYFPYSRHETVQLFITELAEMHQPHFTHKKKHTPPFTLKSPRKAEQLQNELLTQLEQKNAIKRVTDQTNLSSVKAL